MLTKVSQTSRDWDIYLPLVLMAYRSSYHDSTVFNDVRSWVRPSHWSSVLEFTYNKLQITIFICTTFTEIPVGNTFPCRWRKVIDKNVNLITMLKVFHFRKEIIRGFVIKRKVFTTNSLSPGRAHMPLFKNVTWSTKSKNTQDDVKIVHHNLLKIYRWK